MNVSTAVSLIWMIMLLGTGLFVLHSNHRVGRRIHKLDEISDERLSEITQITEDRQRLDDLYAQQQQRDTRRGPHGRMA